MSKKSENLRLLKLEAGSLAAAEAAIGLVEKTKHELLAKHYAERADAQLKS